VVDEVYDRLVELIVDGRIAADAPLGIDALSRELGVSTSPIREALARLESTGLVRRMALRGYRVAPELTPTELGQLLDARLLIEPAAASNAASRHPTSNLAADLDETIRVLRDAPRGPTFESFREYYEADRRFHRAIIAGTGNPFIAHAYDALGGQFQRFRLFSGRGVTDAEATIAEHSAVRDAIAGGDAVGAEAAMRRHLTGVRSRALGELAES
jgi:DNA-binding GntR family transcriptional regulator